jgi:hypothetical protein
VQFYYPIEERSDASSCMRICLGRQGEGGGGGFVNTSSTHVRFFGEGFFPESSYNFSATTAPFLSLLPLVLLQGSHMKITPNKIAPRRLKAARSLRFLAYLLALFESASARLISPSSAAASSTRLGTRDGDADARNDDETYSEGKKLPAEAGCEPHEVTVTGASVWSRGDG